MLVSQERSSLSVGDPPHGDMGETVTLAATKSITLSGSHDSFGCLGWNSGVSGLEGYSSLGWPRTNRTALALDSLDWTPCPRLQATMEWISSYRLRAEIHGRRRLERSSRVRYGQPGTRGVPSLCHRSVDRDRGRDGH